MTRIVVIGEEARVAGFALAGAEVVGAADAAGVRAAWSALGDDVGVVVLTPAAHRALDGAARPPYRLEVVMPA